MKFVGPVNSARVHCSLVKSQNMLLEKKKEKKKERNANMDPQRRSKRILRKSNERILGGRVDH